jgi:hypothetical protein
MRQHLLNLMTFYINQSAYMYVTYTGSSRVMHALMKKHVLFSPADHPKSAIIALACGA